MTQWAKSGDIGVENGQKTYQMGKKEQVSASLPSLSKWGNAAPETGGVIKYFLTKNIFPIIPCLVKIFFYKSYDLVILTELNQFMRITQP